MAQRILHDISYQIIITTVIIKTLYSVSFMYGLFAVWDVGFTEVILRYI